MAKINIQQVKKDIQTLYPDFTVDENAPSGKNAFSKNFALTDAQGKKFLLKVIVKSQLAGDVNFQQAKDEVTILGSLNSAYLVKLLEQKENDNYFCMKFDFLTGKTLQEFSIGKTYTEKEITDFAIQVLRGFADLRRQGIVHQDIKPDNIFVKNDGQVVILDFGSARFKKSPFRGASRSNHNYSSPEQILASRPGNAQLLRKTLDDRSDVYGLGIILHEMVCGTHPFSSSSVPAEAIYSNEKIPLIARHDISDNLKALIYSMLTWQNYKRPGAVKVLACLEQGESIERIPFGKGELFYSATNGFNRFIEASALKPIFNGVITYADKIASNVHSRVSAMSFAEKFLIDPRCYLIQSPNVLPKSMELLPYYKDLKNLFSDLTVSVAKIKAGDADDFIRAVIEFQLTFGATSVVLPFFYIQEFNDVSWDVDQEITLRAIEIARSEFAQVSIVKGVAFSQAILTSSSKNNLLEYLSSSALDYVDGFTVLIESSPGEVITNQAWLTSAREFFLELLNCSKPVIWSQADMSGLIMGLPGLSLSMGEFQSQRRFNLMDEKAGGGKRGLFYYAPIIWGRIKWTSGLDAISTYGKYSDFFCNEPCCSSLNFNSLPSQSETELALHMLISFRGQFNKYVTTGGKALAKKDIENAIIYYKELSRLSFVAREAVIKDFKPNNETFLQRWLDSFHGL